MPEAIDAIRSGVLAAAAMAALVPGMVSGQSGPNPSYHLMQLSVETSEISLERFRQETQAIRDCGDARKVGEALGADIRKNRFVPSWELPETVKTALEQTETGHATDVFSNDPGIMRVLVICHRL